MRTLLIGSLFFVFVLTLGGCGDSNNVNNNNNVDPVVYAEISWTQDVTSINMTEVGVETSEISQNNILELLPGKGKIYWVSAGVEYSKNIDVQNSEKNNEGGDFDEIVECEQEGEYEGENEECIFSFSFAGDVLTISKR